MASLAESTRGGIIVVSQLIAVGRLAQMDCACSLFFACFAMNDLKLARSFPSNTVVISRKTTPRDHISLAEFLG